MKKAVTVMFCQDSTRLVGIRGVPGRPGRPVGIGDVTSARTDLSPNRIAGALRDAEAFAEVTFLPCGSLSLRARSRLMRVSGDYDLLRRTERSLGGFGALALIRGLFMKDSSCAARP